jgi:parallel beta-helix repeat protein
LSKKLIILVSLIGLFVCLLSLKVSLGVEIELYYDDGMAESGHAPTLALYTYAVRFHSPSPSETYRLTKVKFYIYSDPASFKLDIRDASIQPLHSETVTPTGTGWFTIDLTSKEIIVEGDFWVGMKYLTLHQPKLGADTSNPDVESGESATGFPSSPNISSLDWMIRATIVPSAAPITEWRKTFGGADQDNPWSVVQTADGGYLIVGDTLSYGAGSDDVWVVKTDSLGNKEWSKPYGGSNYDRGRSVARTFDGGYIIAGYTNSYGAGIDDFWLVKLDADGNKEWDRTIGDTGRDRACFILQRVDGGYAIVGYTKSVGAGNEDVLLVKISDDGQESWNWYGGSNSDVGLCLVQSTDGGFAIAGYTNSFGSGSYDFYLIKTDPNGGLQWAKTYGGTGSDQAYSVIQTADGGYLLAGDTTSGAGPYDFMLVKTDKDGNIKPGWPKTYGGSGADTVWAVIETYDGGFLVVGDTTSYGAGAEDFWLVKTDSSGNVEWTRTYGGTGSDTASSIQQTGDGGYVVTGRTNSYGAGQNDFWLIKLSSESPSADLNILPKMQRKDTLMLCLEGCPIDGSHAWDVQHRGDWSHSCSHCGWYCGRSSISMITSYYGGYLSQDRISFYVFHERNPNPVAESDLGHEQPAPPTSDVSEVLSWALNGATINRHSDRPTFAQIKTWIDSGSPILRRDIPDLIWHATVIDGYEDTSQTVHVIDPWNGDETMWPYSTLPIYEVWVPSAGATGRSDEDWNSNGTPDTTEDYDSDGVIDFDEIYRFFTQHDDPDSDSDGVPDKAEIISYTFLNDRSFDAADVRKPDVDNDGLRAELDMDSDNGGVRDGLEDKNGNGFVDLGETDPLDPSDDPNTVHLESRQDNDASSNLGTITFDSIPYSLPNDITKPADTYPIEYTPVPSYEFDHWEYTLMVSVTDPYAQTTTATITGEGTLTAIFRVVATPVHNLDTGLNYTTIQAAIDAAETLGGHTIFVEEGTYYENVVVYKSLSLIGASRFATIIDGNFTGAVVEITASNVNLTGFTLQNSENSGWYRPDAGIYVNNSNSNCISNNILIDNNDGVRLDYSSNNNISGNTITDNNFGIWFSSSSSNLLKGNTLASNMYHFRGYGWNDVDTSNMVDGKPVYYWISKRDMVVPLDAGYVVLINCTGITVQNLNLTHNWDGLILAQTANSTISQNDLKNNGHGIRLVQSSNISISSNNSTNNYSGIVVSYSSDTMIYGNNLQANSDIGIWLCRTQSNTVHKNNVTDSLFGLYIEGDFWHTKIYGNTISNHDTGIMFGISDWDTVVNNTFCGNTIENNEFGIDTQEGSDPYGRDNFIFHNNFINNVKHAYMGIPGNFRWDDGYPSGGNYWSGYVDVDDYRGISQNETGRDGIWDHWDIGDRYPLTKPYGGPHDIGITDITTSKTIVGQGYTLKITIEALNYGTNIETSNLTAYANTTFIETITNMVLTSRNSTNITFTWNTTGVAFGNYTISAYATPVVGEIEIDDNTRIDGKVFVTFAGDVNGDGEVDASDLFDLSKVYGLNSSKPNWDPNCDLNDDGKVDASDLFGTSKNYGKTNPEVPSGALVASASLIMALVVYVAVPKWRKKQNGAGF